MKILSLLLIVLASATAVIAQQTKFSEQLGLGYSSGIKSNDFSPGGNSGGFAFGTVGDFVLNKNFGLGLGVDINIIGMNHIEESLTPVFADFRIMGQGRWKPYIALDPGFCLYYNNLKNGNSQRGSWYAGAASGLWFPSKHILHFFIQAKYNYQRTLTSYTGSAGKVSGSLDIFNFLAGYAF